MGLFFDIFARDKTAQAFNAVKGKVDGLESAFGRLGRAAGGLKGLIAGAFSAAFLNAAAQAADHLNDLSVRLGVSAKVLSQYQLVAAETGVEVGSIGKAMQMLAKNSLEAANKQGAARDALSSLGLNAAKFAALPIDEKFSSLATAMERVEDPSQRVQVAMALMGKSGAEMLQVMAEGGAGLDDMRRKADALGITLEETEVSAIDGMFDALGNLGLQFKAIGQHLVSIFAPAVELGAKALSVVMAGAIALVKDGLGTLIDIFERTVGVIIKGWAAIIGVLSKLPGEAGRAFEAMSKSMDSYADGLIYLKDKTEDVVKAQKKQTLVLDDVAGGHDKVQKKIRETGKISRDVAHDVSTDWNRAADSFTDSWVDALTSSDGSFKGIQQKALDNLKGLGKDMLKGFINNQTSGGFSSLWKNPDSGQLVNSGGGMGSDIFASIANPFQGGFAKGGNFTGGKPMMVGENGAEMLVPRSGGTVIPNHALGKQVVVNMHITTPDAGSFRQSQGQIAAAMAQAIQRGSRNL